MKYLCRWIDNYLHYLLKNEGKKKILQTISYMSFLHKRADMYSKNILINILLFLVVSCHIQYLKYQQVKHFPPTKVKKKCSFLWISSLRRYCRTGGCVTGAYVVSTVTVRLYLPLFVLQLILLFSLQFFIWSEDDSWYIYSNIVKYIF